MDKVINAEGDLSGLSPEERAQYYNEVCESIGLNPLTEPFKYIILNKKLQLYATKSCTEQLRKINRISLTLGEGKKVDNVYVIKAKAVDKDDREDESTGAVSIIGTKLDESSGSVVTYPLTGDALANAIMKAETKAKRRVTLSICGLGYLDESEIETVPNATTVDFLNQPEPGKEPGKEPDKKKNNRSQKKTESTDSPIQAPAAPSDTVAPDKQAETNKEPQNTVPELAEFEVVVMGSHTSEGQPVVIIQPEEIAAATPEAQLIWKEIFPDGTALKVTGHIKDNNKLIPSNVQPVSQEPSQNTDSIILTSTPKAGTFTYKGRNIQRPWAYCQYQGRDNGVFAVGDCLGAFKEGDTLTVSIVDRLEKDGKVMLFIQKAEIIAAKAA
jgi:hypothetical protein